MRRWKPFKIECAHCRNIVIALAVDGLSLRVAVWPLAVRVGWWW